jgi:hypothetical protein
MCERNGQFVVVQKDCGGAFPASVDCGDPLCLDCEKRRAAERRRRWTPTIMRMRYPVLLTLTIKDGPVLAERQDKLRSYFRKLLDLRIGSRNRVKFLELALDYAGSHFAEDPIEVQRWSDRCKDFDKHLGTLPGSARVRDLIHAGIAFHEITCADDWHAHKHLVIDAKYIPQPYLVVLWMWVTEGDGKVVDIRKVDKTRKGIAEAIKYLTKIWEIPEDKRDEFRKAVKGLKRVWPLAGAKPTEVDAPCPMCGGLECHGHLIGIGEHAKFWKTGEVECMCLDMYDNSRTYFTRSSAEQCYKVVPVYLIPREIARHSNSAQGPPVALPW